MVNFSKPIIGSIFLVFFLLSGCLVAFGQETRQGVALVLSGGGSRGMAHVGVLKALEENNIPIDYIAGTSIGAAVGGLYAAGYSPDEIAELFLNKNFDRWINGEIDPGYSYFYTKEIPDAGWIDLSLDFSNKYSKILPPKIKNPADLDFGLMKLFSGASAAANYNFDSLMIPFRCVCADIDSNRAFIIKDGNLANAVRASVTFPFLFKPIEIDGKLLFDGGMYNNFPTDIAREDFMPAFIIGSKVSGNYPKPDPDDVLSQIQNMLMTNTDFSLDTNSGVLIEPQVERVNLTDFSSCNEFINSGYEETIKKIPEIKRKVSQKRNKEIVASQREIFKQKKPAHIIDSIYIEGLSAQEQKYVHKTLVRKSTQLTLDGLEPYYYKLVTDDKLIMQGIKMKYNPSKSKYDLYLKLKPANKFNLKFGGNISTRLANEAFVEISYRDIFQDAMKLKLNVYFGRFYSSVLFDGRFDFPGKTSFYAGTSIVYNHYDYFKSTIHFIEDATPSFLIQNEKYLNVYGGIPTGIHGKLEAEVYFGLTKDAYYQNNIFSREDTSDVTNFTFVKPGLVWELNSLNRKQYASSGARLRISSGLVTGEEEFIAGSKSHQLPGDPTQKHDWIYFDLLWDNYFQNIGPVKLGFYGRLYMSNESLFSNYTSSLLAAPAFEPIPESKTLFLPQFRAYNYGAAGLKVVWNITRKFDLRGEAYLFQPYQEIKKGMDNTAYFGNKLSQRYWMLNSALVYHTYIGPISLSLNYFENPEEKVFVALNIGFLIFNPNAMK